MRPKSSAKKAKCAKKTAKKTAAKAPVRSGTGTRSSAGGMDSKYLFLLFFLGVLALAILIVRPFLSTLIVTAILTYAIYPVFAYFHKITEMKRFSAAILIIMILLLLSIPLLLITGKLSQESYSVYTRVKALFLGSDAFIQACAAGEGVVCGAYSTIKAVSQKYELDLGFHFAQAFSALASGWVAKASDFILNIPRFLLHLFIGIFAMYYMLVDGKTMLAGLKKALPMKDEDSDRILSRFNEVIYATIHGAIVLAIMQGAVACIGYFIFGVTSPIILGLFTTVAAFIPFGGSALVWLPVSLSMLINGIILGDQTLMLKAGGLVLWGALLVSTIDNFLRPKIVGDRARVHPLIILLGVFGGIALFGFAGIMVGPLLLTLFVASLKIYEQEKANIV
ncbi:AI-2E family transporter [Candidatus Woesearchaeota archaeon]|nr:AI-2E family transporter [Candidatus Woesearchaeota archaeon]